MKVPFTWSEDQPEHPAYDVLVRLIGLTDHAQDDGELDPYLMVPEPDGRWSLTLDLPADLRTSYQVCPIRDEPLRGRVADEDRWTAIMAAGVVDPSAERSLPPGCTYGNPGPASILDLPGSELPTPGTKLTEYRLGDSIVSAFVPDEPLGLAIFFDGRQWADLDVAGLLANLTSSGRIPPMVAVLVESVHGRRRLETLTQPTVLLPFLTDELLPFVRREWSIDPTPEQTVLIGQSLGGLAATYAAWSRPDLFGAVIGQSSSFWWQDDSGGLSGEVVVDAIASGPPAPIRFYLEAGSNERDLLTGNRRLAAILSNQGYSSTYREYQGGHDYACWYPNLTSALTWITSST